MAGMKDLFGDEPYVPRQPHQVTRSTDPLTSYVAPEYVLAHLLEIQRTVYQALLAAGPRGLTHLELEEICKDHGSTFRTRCSELVEVGLVLNSGRKLSQARPGKRPRDRIVWVASKFR